MQFRWKADAGKAIHLKRIEAARAAAMAEGSVAEGREAPGETSSEGGALLLRTLEERVDTRVRA